VVDVREHGVVEVEFGMLSFDLDCRSFPETRDDSIQPRARHIGVNRAVHRLIVLQLVLVHEAERGVHRAVNPLVGLRWVGFCVEHSVWDSCVKSKTGERDRVPHIHETATRQLPLPPDITRRDGRRARHLRISLHNPSQLPTVQYLAEAVCGGVELPVESLHEDLALLFSDVEELLGFECVGSERFFQEYVFARFERLGRPFVMESVWEGDVYKVDLGVSEEGFIGRIRAFKAVAVLVRLCSRGVTGGDAPEKNIIVSFDRLDNCASLFRASMKERKGDTHSRRC